jgi:hypothetical protein
MQHKCSRTLKLSLILKRSHAYYKIFYAVIIKQELCYLSVLPPLLQERHILSMLLGSVKVGDKLFPWQREVLIPALHGRRLPVGLCPLSPCLRDESTLCVVCFPKPLFALSHKHCVIQHYTLRLLAIVCSPPMLQVQNPLVLQVRHICSSGSRENV